jgi:uncharacterized protein (TIGR03067 family)
MPYKVCIIVGLASLMIAHATAAEKDKGKDANKSELAALKGAWVVESQVENGEKAEIADGSLELDFDDKKATVRIGTATVELEFRIDPTTTPKIIDFKVVPKESGAAAQESIEGIYELLGKDRLRICIRPPTAGSRERPTAFESKAGSNTVLSTLRRKER